MNKFTNKKIINFTRDQIKEGLSKLEDKHRLFFKRLYSHENLDKPINEVVDNIPEERLSWALTQVENSLKMKRENKK